MKRNLGTIVLFALLVLTITALTKIDAPKATAVGSKAAAQQTLN